MKSTEPAGRRNNHVEMPVAYAAVGASKAPDLLRFPPEGTTPYEERLRLGSGHDRFLLASSHLMTWGAQRGAGIAVDDIDRGSGSHYSGPSFDAEGRPEAAPHPAEEHFGPEGDPFILAGTTAVLRVDGQDPRCILVIYTVDEERRIGFAWGTADELGAVGEQLFFVEHRSDDTVWAVARGFLSAPKSGLLGLKARSDLRSALDAVKTQIAALAPGAIAVPATATAGNSEAAPVEVEASDTDVPVSAENPAPARSTEPAQSSEADGSAERTS